MRRFLFSVIPLAALALVGWFIVIPWPRGLDSRNPERTALMDQRIREARATGVELHVRQEWVPLEQISRHLIRAVIVAEDDRFHQHSGVDWLALAEEVSWEGGDTFSWRSRESRAALRDAVAYVWTHRDELRGRSTITQQLAKNLYFGTDRTLLRKGMEVIVAGRLERRLDKDRILEIYLNVAEWGPGLFGAEAAAQEYFGRSAINLGVEQAAALAGTLPHPLTSNPAHAPARMRWRQALILQRLNPAIPSPPGPIPVTAPTFGPQTEYEVQDLEDMPSDPEPFEDPD